MKQAVELDVSRVATRPSDEPLVLDSARATADV